MRKIEIDDIRQIQLGIMDKIDEFCRSKNLRYSLAYGTLLGLVRHHGYIPWDDDLDIMMPRPDYEIFIQSFVGAYKELTVQCPQYDDTYNRAFAKVYDNRTIIIEPTIRTGVFVDIFPIDGVSRKEDAEKWIKDYEHYQYLLGKVSKFYKFQKNKVYLYLKYLLKIVIYPSRENILKQGEALWNETPFDAAPYCVTPSIAISHLISECMDADIFKHYASDLTFEGRHYLHIHRWDEFLTGRYGNYMQLPPKEEQVPHHEPNVFWKDDAKS